MIFVSDKKPFTYKKGLLLQTKLSQYREVGLQSNVADDPPVENINLITIDKAFLVETIENAQENYKKKKYDAVHDQLNFWYTNIELYSNFLTKSFYRETDFCNFLLVVASNDQDICLQYDAIIVIVILTNISSISIDEFIDSFGMDLFVALSNDQRPNVRLNGYQILKHCLNTPKGLDAFLSKDIIDKLINSFDAFLEHPEPSDIIQAIVFTIADIFHNYLWNSFTCKSIDSDKIPKNVPKMILNVFIHALKVGYDAFYQIAVSSAALIVQFMNDDGNLMILKKDFLGEVCFELNSTSNEKLIPILELLMMIFSQKNKNIKILLFEKIPQKLLIKQFLCAEIDSKVYFLLMNTISNCFLCGLDDEWLIESRSIEKFRKVYEVGNYLSKEATTRCLMIAVYITSLNTCEALFDSDLLIPAIQFIKSISDDNTIIKMLQIMNRMLEKIYRNQLDFGLDLQEAIFNVLQDLLDIENDKIAHLSQEILKNYFSDFEQ